MSDLTGPPGTCDVLVVEDDADIRVLVTSRLQRRGHRVRGAATGEAGLAELAHAVPDLLVLDVLLPGIDGWEVLRQLRDQPVTAAVPVLVLSIERPAAPPPALEPGRFLAKPFGGRDFEDAVDQLLGHHLVTEGRRGQHPRR